MSNPNDSRYRLAMRVVAGFLLAALATYIPFLALGLYIQWDLKRNPPPPPAMVTGDAILILIVGPMCSLVAAIVAAFLVGYRKIHLSRMAFGILASVSLAIVAIMIAVFNRVLEFL